MISQPPDYQTSQAQQQFRAASSVASAHSSARSKRYNRSHTGGTPYTAQNEFPVFSHSGDVEIVVGAGGQVNRYLLHRHTLTRCSGFFEASTSKQWSRASMVVPAELPADGRDLGRGGEDSAIGMGGGSVAGSRSGSGSDQDTAPAGMTCPPRKRWRYELDPGTGSDDIAMLVQKECDDGNSSTGPSLPPDSIFGGRSCGASTSASREKSAAATTSSPFFRSVASLPLRHDEAPLSQADADLLRDYDNLFRVFYNYPPVLDAVNIADAYVQCKSLLALADQYDALAVCGPRVDHHLLQFQSRLWKQIAKYPVSYLRLAYLSRSRIIFQEALIHVVGQWPAGQRSIRSALPGAVLDIIEDKVDELEETVSRVEGRLFRLCLTTSRGERVTPATSFLDWLAMSFYRHWLADHITLAPPPPRADGQQESRSDPHQMAQAVSMVTAATTPTTTPPPPPPPTTTTTMTTTTTPSLARIGRVYRTLGSVNSSSYLGHEECKRFLKLTPHLYSRDNLRRFEKGIDELKLAARELVKPLMGSALELDTVAKDGGSLSTAPVSYLTCVKVMDRDLPWGDA